MNNYTTPDNHKDFLALRLASDIDDEISDCAIAYIAPGGGGPSPDHIHDHDHLFTVISGNIEITVGNEKIKLGPGQSARIEGEKHHSVWNTESTPAKVIGISLTK